MHKSRSCDVRETFIQSQASLLFTVNYLLPNYFIFLNFSILIYKAKLSILPRGVVVSIEYENNVNYLEQSLACRSAHYTNGRRVKFIYISYTHIYAYDFYIHIGIPRMYMDSYVYPTLIYTRMNSIYTYEFHVCIWIHTYILHSYIRIWILCIWIHTYILHSYVRVWLLCMHRNSTYVYGFIHISYTHIYMYDFYIRIGIPRMYVDSYIYPTFIYTRMTSMYA